ncbi:MAG: N5-glutamine methyltransferase family protein, partial [Stackebrandtia sp.]
ARRRPLQHLTGSAGFWRFDLAVGPGVFIPRPETELLAEWALRSLQGVERPTAVDLCAGSGAIAKAILCDRPDATVYAVEADDAAAAWLRRNLADTSAAVVRGDAVAGETLAELDGTCDAVLSNPPYVPTHVVTGPEVAADPPSAVYAGADGLDVIRPLAPRCAALLRPGGVVAIEHDETHGQAVVALLRSAGLVDVADHRDLAGRPRFATARRPG